jgi:hypothetical protein
LRKEKDTVEGMDVAPEAVVEWVVLPRGSVSIEGWETRRAGLAAGLMMDLEERLPTPEVDPTLVWIARE